VWDDAADYVREQGQARETADQIRRNAMKIDNTRIDPERATAAAQTEAESATRPGAATRGVSAGADQVRFSSGASLASTAATAASQTPDIRPEVVERARLAVDAGQVGADEYRLADVLIDRALGGE
jgi:anti-sigma28 factor (negative regulator of flagellin synthesis)